MEPSALNSFLSAAALAGLDLWLLALAVNSLGTNPNGTKLTLLSMGVVAKFGLLALGFYWMSKQAWFLKPWAAGGAVAPFALFVLWQALRLQAAKKNV